MKKAKTFKNLAYYQVHKIFLLTISPRNLGNCKFTYETLSEASKKNKPKPLFHQTQGEKTNLQS